MLIFPFLRRIDLPSRQRLLAAVLLIISATATTAAALHAQQNSAAAASSATATPAVDPNLYSALRWRLIGPYRAGRVSAVAGVPGDAATHYMGTPGGGVWKTTSGGTTWKPIFDDEHVASIGDVAIAASNSNIIIIGTGEQ